MLFDLLVKADRRDGTRRANRYYELAMHLAHVTAATDLVPSAKEIDAIDAFRTRLLQAMDAAGVPRPGQPSSVVPGRRHPAAAVEAAPVAEHVEVRCHLDRSSTSWPSSMR